MPQMASAGVLRFCIQAKMSSRPPVMETNTVIANSVGRSMMKWDEATVGTAFPRRLRVRMGAAVSPHS